MTPFLNWIKCMQVNDWVLIGTAIFLGAVALFVPYFAELIKRKWFAPDLKIEFELKPPDCHKTKFENNVSFRQACINAFFLAYF